jgi:hypothetical protein
LRAHRKRELEQQSRDERKQQKERVAEGAEFADKEVKTALSICIGIVL